jgi:cell wall assembly regulator SMI1
MSATGSYFEWLAECVPHVARQLRAPAGDAELAELEARLGLPLPEQVRSLYALHDGQEYTAGLGVIYGLDFLSLADVAAVWNEWREVRDDPQYDPEDFDPYEDVFVPGVVRKAYTTPGWVPLFRLPGGTDYFGVDLNPGDAGAYGQVINFGRDEPKKYAAAADLDGFFAVVLQWGRAESASEPRANVEGHVEDLFGHGGLVFERFHARASGEQIELMPFEDDDTPHDVSDFAPSAELAVEFQALLAEIHGYLAGLGRMTRQARCRVSREGTTTKGGFSIWRLTGWEFAGTTQINKAYAALLDRAQSVGRIPSVDIRFWRDGDAWTTDVRTMGE